MAVFWLTNRNNAKRDNRREACIYAGLQRTETNYDKLKNGPMLVSGRCSTTELTALWVETKLKRALRPAAMIFDAPEPGNCSRG
jgi:hypothetical protein